MLYINILMWWLSAINLNVAQNDYIVQPLCYFFFFFIFPSFHRLRLTKVKWIYARDVDLDRVRRVACWDMTKHLQNHFSFHVIAVKWKKGLVAQEIAVDSTLTHPMRRLWFFAILSLNYRHLLQMQNSDFL